MHKKILGISLTFLLLILQILRFNLGYVYLENSISVFDLINEFCWVIAIILLTNNYKSRFLTSIYILMLSGALNSFADELEAKALIPHISEYVLLFGGIIAVIGYNLTISAIESKKVN